MVYNVEERSSNYSTTSHLYLSIYHTPHTAPSLTPSTEIRYIYIPTAFEFLIYHINFLYFFYISILFHIHILNSYIFFCIIDFILSPPIYWMDLPPLDTQCTSALTLFVTFIRELSSIKLCGTSFI